MLFNTVIDVILLDIFGQISIQLFANFDEAIGYLLLNLFDSQIQEGCLEQLGNFWLFTHDLHELGPPKHHLLRQIETDLEEIDIKFHLSFHWIGFVLLLENRYLGPLEDNFTPVIVIV